METKATFVIIEKILDLVFYFINKKEAKEREEDREKLKEDPVDWFNDRYSSRVRPDGDSETESKHSDSQ